MQQLHQTAALKRFHQNKVYIRHSFASLIEKCLKLRRLRARKSKFFSVFIVYLFLLQGYTAIANPSCNTIPSRIQTSNSDAENFLFRLDTLAIASTTGVFRVLDNQNRTHYIRFSTDWAHTDFEVFASHFIRRILGNHIFPVKSLDPDPRNLILDEIKKRWDFRYLHLQVAGVLRWEQTYNLATLPASVTLASEGERGDHYLRKLNIEDLPFQILKEVDMLKNPRGYNLLENPERLSKLWHDWQNLGLKSRTRLEKDLSAVFNIDPSWDRSTFELFCRKLTLMTAEQSQKVVSAILAPLPPHIIKQLAEAWAAYTVLNLPDLHSRNWIVNSNDQVLPFDAAYFNTRPLNIESEVTTEGQHPFGLSELSLPVKLFLIRNLSEEFKTSLRRNTRGILNEALQLHPARHVTTETLQSMVRRAIYLSYYGI